MATYVTERRHVATYVKERRYEVTYVIERRYVSTFIVTNVVYVATYVTFVIKKTIKLFGCTPTERISVATNVTL